MGDYEVLGPVRDQLQGVIDGVTTSPESAAQVPSWAAESFRAEISEIRERQ
jgi:hypothetical protein